MARHRDRTRRGAQSSVDWIRSALAEYAEGVHSIPAGAYLLDSELPDVVAEVYRAFDGLELFHETLVLRPSSQVRWDEGRALVGAVEGDDLWVDRAARVWRLESDTGELIAEGSRFDRWLAGFVCAEAVIYEIDGEFRDSVMDEDGELLTEAAIRRAEALLSRDRDAPGPRWRLARHLSRAGKLEAARDHLEQVVASSPAFAWAWFDLARISEGDGQADGACDELEAAAEAADEPVIVAFFWAQLARVAQAAGAEERRRRAAEQAVASHPGVVREQVDGARALLEASDLEGARELAEVARAIQPRDLDVLDVLSRLKDRQS